MDARLSPNGGTGGLDEQQRKGTDKDRIHPISGLFSTVHLSKPTTPKTDLSFFNLPVESSGNLLNPAIHFF